MATYTTRLAATKPASSENVDITTLNNNADLYDLGVGATVGASSSMPASAFSGRLWYDTSTSRLKVNSASSASTAATWTDLSTDLGVKQIDSFAGASDDAKFVAALAWQAAEIAAGRNTWTLQFPNRNFGPLTTTNTPFSGMRISGPGGNEGNKDLQVGSGLYVNHKVTVAVGNGTSSLFYGTGTYYDIVISDVAFYYSNTTSQFWHQPSGNLYSCNFHSLTHFGAKHVFGSTANKALLTQVVFSGNWQVQAPQDMQFHIGGSDCSLWMGGYLNIGGNPSVAGGGTDLISFNFLAKSDIGYMYITCNNGGAGLHMQGPSDISYALNFHGGKFEGENASTPSTRYLINVNGYHATFYSPWLAFVSDASPGTTPGAIRQIAGHIVLNSPTYMRASSAAATFPMLHQSSGTAQVNGPVCATSGESVRVRWNDGNTTVHANPVSGYDGRLANGAVRPGTPASLGARLFSASGAPTALTGQSAGDFYFRTDTPASASQRIYVAVSASTWSGIA